MRDGEDNARDVISCRSWPWRVGIIKRHIVIRDDSPRCPSRRDSSVKFQPAESGQIKFPPRRDSFACVGTGQAGLSVRDCDFSPFHVQRRVPDSQIPIPLFPRNWQKSLLR